MSGCATEFHLNKQLYQKDVYNKRQLMVNDEKSRFVIAHVKENRFNVSQFVVRTSFKEHVCQCNHRYGS